MAVRIYACGTPSKARPHLRGPPNISDSVLISAVGLPNPYSRVQHESGETRLDLAEKFLRRVAPAKFDDLVSQGEDAVSSNRSVIVQCKFGRDRSRVVARAIQQKCGDAVDCIVFVEE